jgi:hypothetical protein
MRTIPVLFAIAFLSGCAATSVDSDAKKVEIVSQEPDSSKCKFLGEVSGTQGNWITGDYTSNKNLLLGARNDLRNETHDLGGNIVFIQDMKNASASGSKGTTNTTAVGKAYRCS